MKTHCRFHNSKVSYIEIMCCKMLHFHQTAVWHMTDHIYMPTFVFWHKFAIVMVYESLSDFVLFLAQIDLSLSEYSFAKISKYQTQQQICRPWVIAVTDFTLVIMDLVFFFFFFLHPFVCRSDLLQWTHVASSEALCSGYAEVFRCRQENSRKLHPAGVSLCLYCFANQARSVSTISVSSHTSQQASSTYCALQAVIWNFCF